ncbi:hypothetical protein [Phaeobacter porticola]|uniref:Uncharacterized protein n=2 Tax=Phaeobacter TaxID=302485 RepID=A0A1L3I5P5_9RHOB|nr:hypothetical protein [Phaeobacter porticola]APG47418.1 hypothetical protein PhaeoP97_02012 [Phaeobacter porticola]AUR11982.1 hypothetical protein PhaeoP48_01996 [Phaeobacter inhibens]
MVLSAFLISDADVFTGPEWETGFGERPWSKLSVRAAEGMRGVISAATIPFQLEHDSVTQRHFNRFLMAERIRRLKDVEPGAGLKPEDEALASEIAQQCMDDFQSSEVGRNTIRNDIVNGLHRHMQSKNISFATRELLYQAQVSSWSIFENFCKSFIVTWLNEHPYVSKDVLSIKRFQKMIGGQSLNIDNISGFGFDLTKSMGDVIFSGVKLDGFEVLKDLCKVLLSDDRVQRAFGNDLYFLNKSRHLIVHRRAEVDLEFLNSTGKSYQIGDLMHIDSQDIERSFEAVREAILAIMFAAEVRVGSASTGPSAV